ncbi:E3 ubiquitin ligase complex SCF subunit sconC-like [Drosophila ficusphila]|uniref:E3 ubiquitin ligase complex SCF subunit sconC-like n=1 Tax=Drosophila ficusphila TaxID=30025 RepID=UPI0007E7C906|nr:E3 ubiquitin ligase complex SCF subunit sconC-like [Drosophila ficusphila]
MSSTQELEDPKFVKLETSDGVVHTVDIRLIEQMGVLAEMPIMGKPDEVIPLPRVDARTLDFIIAWCTVLLDYEGNIKVEGKDMLKELFLLEENADCQFLLQILLASNYLNLDSLLHAGAELMAAAINSCSSTEEINSLFTTRSS